MKTLDFLTNHTYDVVIIGAGPAGLFSAFQLLNSIQDLRVLIIDKGLPTERRFCPAIEGKCTNCRVCHVISGEGGAGLYSDGKVILNLNVGGHLRDYDPSGFLRETVLDEVFSIFRRFNLIDKLMQTGGPDRISPDEKEKLQHWGIKGKLYKVAYYGSRRIQEFVSKLSKGLSNMGVEWLMRTEV